VWPAISSILERQRRRTRKSTATAARVRRWMRLRQTLGGDTPIYDPDHKRVISTPVSRTGARIGGGYVSLCTGTLVVFGATLAGSATVIWLTQTPSRFCTKRRPEGFFPNYARAGEWKAQTARNRRWAPITNSGALSQVSRPLVSPGSLRSPAALESMVGQTPRLPGLFTWAATGRIYRSILSGWSGKAHRRHSESGLDKHPDVRTAPPTTSRPTCWNTRRWP